MRNKFWIFAAAWCCWFAAAFAGFADEGGAKFSVNVWKGGLDPDSLPQSEVIALTQTRDGYLWLGTPNGLARFDGVKVTKFDAGDSEALDDYQIVHLFEDSRSNLWVGTRTGNIVLIKDGKATIVGGGQRSQDDRLMAACEDVTGAVWLFTANGRLSRYRNGHLDSWPVNLGREGFGVNRSLIAEDSGLVWVGTGRRMIGINPKVDLGKDSPAVAEVVPLEGGLDFLLASQKGGYWRLAGGHVQKCTRNQVDRDLGPYPWSKIVFAACEDLEGNLIVGTLGEGVWWFDASGHATQLSDKDGLSHNYILSLAMDREGSLWVGTDSGGLDRVRRQAFSVLPKTGALNVQSACEDGQGALWFNSRGGVYSWKENELKQYGAPQGLVNTNGQVVFVDRDQKVWAGSGGPQNSPGLFVSQNERFELAPGFERFNQVISAMLQDREGRLWVGTQGGLAMWDGKIWQLSTTRDGMSSDAVHALAEDGKGNIWVGTGSGLNRLQNGKFTVFHKKDGLPGDNISSLYMDAEGVLWIGTNGRGLGRFQNGKWTLFAKKQGLLSNTVGYLMEDGLGSLWMGSPVGLMRIRKEELNNVAAGTTNSFFCRAYGEADGLGASECAMGSQPGPCKTRDGTLWFPTIRGLVSVNAAQIRFNTNPPPVIIEDVLVDGESVSTNGIRAPLPGLVTVPSGKERIEIKYTSLNLAAAKKARFKYRLEGHESGWTDADGSIRTVHYTQLRPGTYTFHVLACNEDEVWNTKGATLAFFIEPPFWRTWWFRGLVTLSVIGLVGGVVHYFSTQRLQRQLEGMRQQQALEKERARIARDIHDQLGASMTQVSLLGEMVESDKENPSEVEAHARQISQTARDTSRVLDEIVWTVNPSNDTLEGLINYICKYAQEYFAVAELRYRLDAPAQLPATEISPDVRHNVFLTAKEAVTNVVRHAKASEVWLRLRLEPGRFILEIQDNGRGPSGNEGKSTRNGLRNMHKRMEDVGGTFELRAAPEGGALVRLTVPISNR